MPHLLPQKKSALFELQKGCWGESSSVAGNWGGNSPQLLKYSKNIHGMQGEILMIKKLRPLGTLSVQLKIHKLSQLYVTHGQFGYFRFSTRTGIQRSESGSEAKKKHVRRMKRP